ncbi:hypothetical protein HanPSC8_Chr17g0755411 [Helianthus annuus]|nr:hypothetical protein HanPSC8_Chr17g0755411 [Helianthus annuus]
MLQIPLYRDCQYGQPIRYLSPIVPCCRLSPNPTSPATSDPIDGYLSDDPAHAKRHQDRQKGAVHINLLCFFNLLIG